MTKSLNISVRDCLKTVCENRLIKLLTPDTYELINRLLIEKVL